MKKLSLRANGSFKILQFTDLHLQDGGTEDQKTITLMELILKTEKPDFVVLTGDTIRAAKSSDPIQAFSLAAGPMEERHIPWSAVFGNHDDEGNATKEDLIQLQQLNPHCLSRSGEVGVSGIGNYDIPVFNENGDISFVLYFFDSGTVAPAAIGGYDWIKRSQIEWYEERSRHYFKIKRTNIPSLAFFHIPLTEFRDLWNCHDCFGSKNEAVGCPKVNTGLFASMVERKDVKGIFVGHDHINDFYGDLFGIRLAYGRATGFNTYGKEGFLRGARIIELKDRTVRTWIRLEDESVICNPPLHKAEGLVEEYESPYVEVQ
ncbi:metallophosphoesterase family protein [Neobacillus sp. PS3-34]|uniref:metallophosphoesterase family protein n=1 Tax=Neobacillus sp. PS3-34 TaxID=3070678 RepID=UPI0027E027D8|nr:metallophosphoesterase family protein [Neobacillus sp. PS3-34]WML48343.1 metallophosphoesterase family protein [Neobacillus sp. PS3-34]